MCGILGVYKCNGISESLFNEQLDAINYRGPDSEGNWKTGNQKCYLGSKRLSINDLSISGNMPMTYDSNFTIVFNGEIYNHNFIRNKLIELGHTFNSKSDTECVLNRHLRVIETPKARYGHFELVRQRLEDVERAAVIM